MYQRGWCNSLISWTKILTFFLWITCESQLDKLASLFFSGSQIDSCDIQVWGFCLFVFAWASSINVFFLDSNSLTWSFGASTACATAVFAFLAPCLYQSLFFLPVLFFLFFSLVSVFLQFNGPIYFSTVWRLAGVLSHLSFVFWYSMILFFWCL